jgi:hypothetical protein
MKKYKYVLISGILITLSLLCVLAFNLIGFYVDEKGFLHELFDLIPIGYLFFFLGVIFGIVGILKTIGKKKIGNIFNTLRQII